MDVTAQHGSGRTATKRIQYHSYGGPEVMRFEEFEPAPLGAKEVLVRVRAAATNPMDFGMRSGGMKIITGRRFPLGWATTSRASSRPSATASPG